MNANISFTTSMKNLNPNFKIPNNIFKATFMTFNF